MPAVMQILDVILADYFNSFLSTVFTDIPGCFVGALPKTQCLDIAHGLQSVIEKGLDEIVSPSSHIDCEMGLPVQPIEQDWQQLRRIVPQPLHNVGDA